MRTARSGSRNGRCNEPGHLAACLQDLVKIPNKLVAVVGPWLRAVILPLLIVPLILGVAYGIAADSTECSADGSAFEPAAALVANDAAKCRATETAYDSTGLSIGAAGAGNAGNCQSESEQFDEFGFHDVWL